MTIRWQSLLFLAVIFLAACGSIEETTPIPPTITPTPISTELPVVETAIPAGFNAENPIQIVIVPENPEVAAERLTEFEDALSDLTDVAITVVLAETQAEAFAAVCASASGTLSAVWVDGMTYAASHLQRCGVAVLQEDTPDGTGESGVLLLNIEYEENGLEEAIEGTFCRSSVDDLYSWTLSIIFYGAAGFGVADIVEVNEVADNDALIADIERGRCSVVGMSETAWEAYQDADEDNSLEESVILAETSPEIPYHVFSFSLAISLDAIADIETALLGLDEASGRADIDPESEEEPSDEAALMAAFFGIGSFESVDSSDFDDMIEFIESSGINFSGLAD